MQPLLLWKNNKYCILWVCVCSLWYPACNAMRHIVICGLSSSTTFFNIISKMAWFSKKKLLNIKLLFWFSLELLSETFFILRRNGRDMIITLCWSSYKVPLFMSHINETWIFSTDFRKVLNYKISWKYVQWEQSCSVGWTEEQTWPS